MTLTTIFCYKKTFQTSYHLRYQLGLLKASPISASSNPIQKARGSRGMVLMVLWGNPNHFQKSAFLPPSPHTFEKAATEILQSVTVTKNIFSHLAKYNKHTRKRKLHFIPSWFGKNIACWPAFCSATFGVVAVWEGGTLQGSGQCRPAGTTHDIWLYSRAPNSNPPPIIISRIHLIEDTWNQAFNIS